MYTLVMGGAYPYQGRIQDFKLGGALKKMFGVFRVKSHDFMPKKIIFFPILGGAPPLGSAPAYMDLNAKYEKRYYEVLLRLIQIRISPKRGKCT